jgi:hypothetical protein
MMLIFCFIYVAIIAFVYALLEIQIKGKDGWAKNLPTWKKKIFILSSLVDNQPFTGYTVYVDLFILLLFHLPFLFISWSAKQEYLIWGLLFFMVLAEDFLWFVLNPHFGLKNFKKDKIPWKPIWWGRIPRSYFTTVFLLSFLCFSI